MSEGTPLDALEAGEEISNAADSAKMAEIMRDINASGGGGGGEMPMPAAAPKMMVSAPPMRPMHPMHPSMMMHAPAANYTAVEEEEYKPRKKNMWSNLSAKLRDPLIVVVLVFALSLPILHTQLAKYAGWAFAIGGQLSWLGLIALSLLAGALFGGIQGVANLIGF